MLKIFSLLDGKPYDAGNMEKAISYFEKGANNGNGLCCGYLANIYLYHKEVEFGGDTDKAIYWAKKGYELKDSYSTGMLGFLIYYSKSNLRDLSGMEQAIKYMTECCDLAEAEENYEPFFGTVANMLAAYYLESHDKKNCNKWLGFITNHYLDTPVVLGNASYMFLVLKDYASAYKYASIAVDDEKLYSNFVLGFCSANGVGGAQVNKEKAFKHIQTAALIGSPNGKAEYMMGVFYEKGIGCTVNISKAKEWYLKGAQKGDSQAILKTQQFQ